MKIKKILSGVLPMMVCMTVHAAGVFSNHAGMQFVDIPAGAFTMGSCKNELDGHGARRGCVAEQGDGDAHDNETPAHPVKMPAFQLMQSEVTVGQFKAFLASSSQHKNDPKIKNCNTYGDDVPVTGVSWNQAHDFIHWLNQTKPMNDAGRYYLPSESEWEYACRAGQSTPFCGGHEPNSVAWYQGNANGKPRRVMTKQANGWGLFDMSGNVSEWVQDCWNQSYINAPGVAGPWLNGKCEWRVRRGGFFSDVVRQIRSTHRYAGTPTQQDCRIGFRVARAGGVETLIGTR
jgi:formylglycine-generating enzyme required for sulfatase activity